MEHVTSYCESLGEITSGACDLVLLLAIMCVCGMSGTKRVSWLQL